MPITRLASSELGVEKVEGGSGGRKSIPMTSSMSVDKGTNVWSERWWEKKDEKPTTDIENDRKREGGVDK